MCIEMKCVLRRQCNFTNKPKGWYSPSILTPLVPFQWFADCRSVSIRFRSEQRRDANEKFNRFSFLTLPHLTFWQRSFTFNLNKSPTGCNNFSVYYPDVCLQLNMFRAFSRPSSGAQWLQWQSLVLPSYRGDSRAVFVVGPASRPARPRTQVPGDGRDHSWGRLGERCLLLIIWNCVVFV